jgi:hypothetical protein
MEAHHINMGPRELPICRVLSTSHIMFVDGLSYYRTIFTAASRIRGVDTAQSTIKVNASEWEHSHICHRGQCVNPNHIRMEAHHINMDREIIDLRVSVDILHTTVRHAVSNRMRNLRSSSHPRPASSTQKKSKWKNSLGLTSHTDVCTRTAILLTAVERVHVSTSRVSTSVSRARCFGVYTCRLAAWLW